MYNYVGFENLCFEKGFVTFKSLGTTAVAVAFSYSHVFANSSILKFVA